MTKLERILHVDDDEDIRSIVQMTLELLGEYTILQCASGSDAIRLARGFSPQLLLLDVMMPEMSGEETLRHLRTIPELEGVPAIFMTAKAERSFAEKLLGDGALAVIIKPFDPSELCVELEEHWQRHLGGQ